MEEVSDLQPSEPVTFNALYMVFWKEILAQTLPGIPTKQALRMFSAMLEALEKVTLGSAYCCTPEVHRRQMCQ